MIDAEATTENPAPSPGLSTSAGVSPQVVWLRSEKIVISQSNLVRLNRALMVFLGLARMEGALYDAHTGAH